jgi:hypothetical protein
MTLRPQNTNCTQDACLLTRISHHKAKLSDFAARFSRQLHDFVDQHNRKIVNDKPTHVFKVISSLRTASAR